jgi:hypothetical protein
VILRALSWDSRGGLKGAKGGILYMPVPLETTLNYTLETLREISMPNAANMVIVVKSTSRAGDVSRTTVDMNKVRKGKIGHATIICNLPFVGPRRLAVAQRAQSVLLRPRN